MDHKSPKGHFKNDFDLAQFGIIYSVILLKYYCYFISTNILFDSFKSVNRPMYHLLPCPAKCLSI